MKAEKDMIIVAYLANIYDPKPSRLSIKCW